ncbi:hypothetical protein CPB84DRAFT_1850740 [Gymnopilus junonius]|uniref:Uncharacterized protein n=1 Tax=Gymnopilus junonius TaxID=109634 RepID=A0A9P5NDP0_GYMJU|nr:hypothetical protein CPB84DRAFT_1850740 [Gymnopilus junonius]
MTWSNFPDSWCDIKALRNDYNTRDQASKSELRKNDIIILVAGLTGSEKSRFINTLLEKERMAVGETLASCTAEIDYEIIGPIPAGDNS